MHKQHGPRNVGTPIGFDDVLDELGSFVIVPRALGDGAVKTSLPAGQLASQQPPSR